MGIFKRILASVTFSDPEVNSVSKACDEFFSESKFASVAPELKRTVKNNIVEKFNRAWASLQKKHLELAGIGKTLDVSILKSVPDLLKNDPMRNPEDFGKGLGMFVACIEYNLVGSLLDLRIILQSMNALKGKSAFYKFAKTTIVDTGSEMLGFLKPEETARFTSVISKI